jgi:dihydroorotate dehydrogenase subfamily 1
MSDRLTVNVNGIAFKNPVMPAAGPNVRTGQLMLKAVEGGAGGIVSKTVSVVPAGDPRPTIRRTSNRGLMNCETWSEIPVEEFIEECRRVKAAGVPLIVSIGYKPDEVRRLGPWIEREIAPDAIEFSTHYVGRSVDPLVEVARALRDSVSVPIWMKISPNFPDIEALARSVSPIVDSFVAINSYGPVIDFDVETGAPVLGSDYGQGWMSGPPILPIALRVVYQLTAIQDKPVIGVGGIEKGVDAIKFFMVGASAVQMCSAAIKSGHQVYGKVAGEMDAWLEKHGYASVAEIKDLYKTRLRERQACDAVPVMSVDEAACTGCRACLSRCIQGALQFNEAKNVARVLPENCIGCGFCQDYCTYNAMALVDR